MINILDESVNITDIKSGIYVDPHYIPYLEEYLKYVNSNDTIVASYQYVVSIQMGKVQLIYNKKAIPHIRKWIPEWFRPCNEPFENTIYDHEHVSLYRYYIYEEDVNIMLEILTEYPKTDIAYPSVVISPYAIGILEVFDDYYTVTSNHLFAYQIQKPWLSQSYEITKFGNPIDEIFINNKECGIWKFPLKKRLT